LTPGSARRGDMMLCRPDCPSGTLRTHDIVIAAQARIVFTAQPRDRYYCPSSKSLLLSVIISKYYHCSTTRSLLLLLKHEILITITLRTHEIVITVPAVPGGVGFGFWGGAGYGLGRGLRLSVEACLPDCPRGTLLTHQILVQQKQRF